MPEGSLLQPAASCPLPPSHVDADPALPELLVCQEKLGIWRFLGILLSTNSIFKIPFGLNKTHLSPPPPPVLFAVSGLGRRCESGPSRTLLGEPSLWSPRGDPRHSNLTTFDPQNIFCLCTGAFWGSGVRPKSSITFSKASTCLKGLRTAGLADSPGSTEEEAHPEWPA